MLRQVLVLCVVFAIASASVERSALEPLPEKYKGQEGCYIKELDVVIPFGKHVPSKEKCVDYACSSSHVEVSRCTGISVRPPCKLIVEKDKPYPYCCPELEC